MDRRKFSERVGKELKARGWTQREFGEKCGISQPSISSYIRGLETPGGVNLKKIAEALGMSSGYLAGEHDRPDGPEAGRTTRCRRCSAPIPESYKSGMCDRCKQERYRENRLMRERAEREQAGRAVHKKWKSEAARLNAEAREHGMSYGKYTARLRQEGKK